MQQQMITSPTKRASLTNPLTHYTIKRLIHLNEQSERGFEAAAQHVKNRGFKIVLKTYAQQRKAFAQELSLLLNVSSGDAPAKMFRLRSLFAMLHRGWLDIRAAMTIGREAVEGMMSREALRVEEKIVAAEYQQALTLALPEVVIDLIQKQLTQLEAVVDQLALLAGKDNQRLLIQLYDSNPQVNGALRNLHQIAGPTEDVEIYKVQEFMERYECNCYGSRMLEGTSVGAFAGMFLGIISTLLLGLVAMWGVGSPTSTTLLWLTISGAGFGILLGGLFGFLLSHATSEDDEYIYQKSLQDDAVLLFATVPIGQAKATRSYLETMRWHQQTMVPVGS
ncbi:MAG: PA2169 family four-helix-bundle protein [Chloroflexota bacterium]